MTMATNELAVVANIDDLVAGNDGRHHLKMGTRSERGREGVEQPKRTRAREGERERALLVGMKWLVVVLASTFIYT